MNNNGVRDDVERYIYANYFPDMNIIAALNQYANALGAAFDGVTTSVSFAYNITHATQCLAHLSNDDADWPGMLVDVAAEMLDIVPRMETVDLHYQNLSGSMFIMSPIEQWQDSCEFTIQ